MTRVDFLKRSRWIVGAKCLEYALYEFAVPNEYFQRRAELVDGKHETSYTQEQGHFETVAAFAHCSISTEKFGDSIYNEWPGKISP